MTWPTVQVDQLNQYQGETKDVERVVLFLGVGAVNVGKLIAVNNNSDFDVLLGAADSTLKNMLAAARDNAGQNWFAHVHVLPANAVTADWVAAVTAAQQVVSVEGYVLTMPVSTKADIQAAATLRNTLIGGNGRWLWAILAVQKIQDGETWADYVARLAELQDGIAAPSVQLVPILFGNEPGELAGRLANRSVTVADSPARVKTGAVVSMGSSEKPVDDDGVPLSLATLQTLNENRYSVPMWYLDYDGIYWADGVTLEVEGGDYQVIEYVRVADKVARRVRLQAIPKIADRSLNSSDASIAAHQTYFGKTLRDMSKATEINSVAFPGEVETPQEGDVVINWLSKVQVQVYVYVRPYRSAKQIQVGILLDVA